MIDLEYYDNLPVRESRKDLMFRHEFWNSWYRRSYKIEYWNIAERVIEEHIGKYFNDAFSKFKFLCKNIPEATYEYFMSYFGEKYICRRYEEYIYHRYKDFIIDNEGKIQYSEYYYSKKKNKPISITSRDFKNAWVHKESGIFRDDFLEIYENPNASNYDLKIIAYIHTSKVMRNYGWLVFKKHFPLHKWIYAKPDDFELKTIQGWEKTFNSRRDPNYKRLMADASKPKRKNSKQSMSEEKFREILNSRKPIKNEEENKYKILKHGFDPIISFRN